MAKAQFLNGEKYSSALRQELAILEHSPALSQMPAGDWNLARLDANGIC